MTRTFEGMAAQDPDGYRRRLQSFSRLGTLYILGVLLIVLGLLAGTVFALVFTKSGSYLIGKVGIFVLILAYGIFRALWVKFDPPEGTKVARADAPELFAEVDALSQRLGAPRIDHIILDIDANAAAAEVPRLGIFGWPKFVLILGAPLLYRFQKDELISVIAHELGHFSGRHGDLGRRIYRVYATWHRLGEHFARYGGGAWLFSKFHGWYMPRLEAMSSAMRREHEFHADAAAVSAVGAEAGGKAFMRLSTMSDAYGKAFWKPIRELAKSSAEPPQDLAVRFQTWTQSAWNTDDAFRAIRADLAEETDADDSHPSLSQRLAKMGFATEGRLQELANEASRPPDPSAAEAIFGANLGKFEGFLSKAFTDSLAKPWKAENAELKELVEYVAKTEAKRAAGPISADEERGLAYSAFRLQGREVAEPLYREFLAKHPDDPDALCTMAEILLAEDDPAGIEFARRAISGDERFYQHTYAMLYRFYRRSGNFEAIKAMKSGATEAFVKTSIDESAATTFDPMTDYIDDPWNESESENLLRQVKANPKVLRVYAVKHQLPATGRWQRCLVVERASSLVTVDANDAAQKLMQALADFKEMPDGIMFYVPANFKPWRRRFEGLGIQPMYEAKGE